MQKIVVQVETLKEAAEGKPTAVEIVDEARLTGGRVDSSADVVKLAVTEGGFRVCEPQEDPKWVDEGKWYVSCDERWRLTVRVVRHRSGLIPNPDGIAWTVDLLVGPIAEQLRVCIPPTQQSVTIGRSRQDCDIFVADSKVSSQHAVIRFSRGQARVSDLGSSSGVKLGGVKITASDSASHVMKAEHVAEIGHSRFNIICPVTRVLRSDRTLVGVSEPLHAIPSARAESPEFEGDFAGAPTAGATQDELAEQDSEPTPRPIEEAEVPHADSEDNASATPPEASPFSTSQTDRHADLTEPVLVPGYTRKLDATVDGGRTPEPEQPPDGPDPDIAITRLSIAVAALVVLIALGVVLFLYIVRG